MAARKKVAVNKRRAFKFGSGIAKIKAGKGSHVFLIHADLLCSKSAYFREKIQKNRKAMTGDCLICYGQMEVGIKALTYCTTCGQNFHEHCIKQWHGTNDHPTCPHCRASWTDPNIEKTIDCPDFKSSACEIYSEWLYSGRISLSLDRNDDDDKEWEQFSEDSWQLAKAYVLGEQLEDPAFSNAVLEAWLESIDTFGFLPEKEEISYIHERVADFSKVSKMLVEVYKIYNIPFSFEEHAEQYPRQFLADLALALLDERNGLKPDIEVLKKSIFGEAESE